MGLFDGDPTCRFCRLEEEEEEEEEVLVIDILGHDTAYKHRWL